MTEIKIQKKKSVTPYVLLSIFLLGVVVYFLFAGYNKKVRDEQFFKSDLTAVIENNEQVNAYLAFTKKGDLAIPLDHAYANEALTKLVDATGSLADELGFDIKEDMKKANLLTEKIMQDPFAFTHSSDLRKTGDIIAASLNSMQRVFYPGLSAESAEVQRTIAKINPQILTLNQNDEVNSFFKSAAVLLQKMN